MGNCISEVIPPEPVVDLKVCCPKSESLNGLQAGELSLLIQQCVLNNRESQKKIYLSFFGFAMSICDRYTNNREDSLEIINDGFLKLFKKIDGFKPGNGDILCSFKAWLRKILVNASIDHFRRKYRQGHVSDLQSTGTPESEAGENAVDRISYTEIIGAIRELKPVYRTVFNLFVIEGFSHEQISKELKISIGTSKSNLTEGRKQLLKHLGLRNQFVLIPE